MKFKNLKHKKIITDQSKLIGLRGKTYLDAGYIFAPYPPTPMKPVQFTEEDFKPRKGILSRYSKKLIKAEFYSTVSIQSIKT